MTYRHTYSCAINTPENDSLWCQVVKFTSYNLYYMDLSTLSQLIVVHEFFKFMKCLILEICFFFAQILQWSLQYVRLGRDRSNFANTRFTLYIRVSLPIQIFLICIFSVRIFHSIKSSISCEVIPCFIMWYRMSLTFWFQSSWGWNKAFKEPQTRAQKKVTLWITLLCNSNLKKLFGSLNGGL
jgi:hypothetical protein